MPNKYHIDSIVSSKTGPQIVGNNDVVISVQQAEFRKISGKF